MEPSRAGRQEESPSSSLLQKSPAPPLPSRLSGQLCFKGKSEPSRLGNAAKVPGSPEEAGRDILLACAPHPSWSRGAGSAQTPPVAPRPEVGTPGHIWMAATQGAGKQQAAASSRKHKDFSEFRACVGHGEEKQQREVSTTQDQPHTRTLAVAGEAGWRLRGAPSWPGAGGGGG